MELDYFDILDFVCDSSKYHEKIKAEQILTYERYLADPEKEKHKEFYYNKKGELWPYIGGRTQYKIRCKDCCLIRWRRKDNLKNNHSQTCPICRQPRLRNDYTLHYQVGRPINPKDDLRGRTFDGLLVNNVQPYDNGYGHAVYNCTCLVCGETEDFEDDDLKRNHAYCSYCNESKADSALEKATMAVLNSLDIPFDHIVKFDNLRGVRNGRLSYDFQIEHDGQFILIECQGLQHYEPVDIFGGEEQFEIQQEHDRRKRSYAHKNGYRLIEIKYDCKDIQKFLLDNF